MKNFKDTVKELYDNNHELIHENDLYDVMMILITYDNNKARKLWITNYIKSCVKIREKISDNPEILNRMENEIKFLKLVHTNI